MGELRTVRADADDLKRAGLTVRVEHAQWATGKGQVWLRYEPPGGSPAAPGRAQPRSQLPPDIQQGSEAQSERATAHSRMPSGWAAYAGSAECW
jgi:hypothetical protein